MLADQLAKCLLPFGGLFLLATGSTAQGTGQPQFQCPDDGQSTFFSNMAGGTDKIVVLQVNQNEDTEFTLEAVDGSGMVIASVEYTGGSDPSITVPPGATARVRDPMDTNTKKPKGTYDVHS